MVDRLSRLVFISLHFFFLLFNSILGQQFLNSRQERLALLQLRSSLGLRGRDWPLRSDPCTQWLGIQCTNGRVTGVNISRFRRTRIANQNPQFSVEALQNLTLLSSFNASNFALPGPIPEWLGFELNALQVLDLRSCSINGTIPFSLGNLSSLVELHLSDNNLTGVIPDQLGYLSNLVDLDLGFNSLSGPLPLNLRVLRSLQRMVLSHNGFNGEIPDELWSIPSLQFLDMSVNNFTGVLPNATSAVNARFAILNISRNSFYGNITPMITRFTYIDMSGNYFVGPVSVYTCGNSSLSRNCLTNVTNQRNATECGSFYSEKNLVFGNFGDPNITQTFTTPSKRRISLITLASIFGGVGLIVLVIFILVLWIICKKKRGKTNQIGTTVGPVPAGGVPPPSGRVSLNFSNLGDKFTYEHILQATGELNDANLIKHGHSGDIFNGTLEGGIPVVIKKVDSLKKGSCRLELELFSKVTHTRLVPLLGHCLENENEKFLVYKHMPNGDLSSSLFKETMSDDSLKSLDWITRLKIAIGAAEGLAYLHHECTPPLVHRDIQASSILLDDEFEVRLGSLSKVCAQEGDNHQNRITRLLRFPQISDQGTSGMPNATCAYDVYCFGKFLLELVTGKLGISSSTGSTTKEHIEAVLPYISAYDKELVTNIVDPSLIIDDDLLEEVWAMAIVARSCLNPKPTRRPLTRYILKALENPLKVVREEHTTTSARLRTNSSRASWNNVLFGSWRYSSTDVAAVGPYQKVEGMSGFEQEGNSGSQGSGQNGEGYNGHSSSTRSHSEEIFPKPLEEHDIERANRIK